MKIACVGDTSTHGGSITTSGGNSGYKVNGSTVALNGAILNCPDHGNQSLSAITTTAIVNGKLVLSHGAIAPCGATVISPERGVHVI